MVSKNEFEELDKLLEGSDYDADEQGSWSIENKPHSAEKVHEYQNTENSKTGDTLRMSETTFSDEGNDEIMTYKNVDNISQQSNESTTPPIERQSCTAESQESMKSIFMESLGTIDPLLNLLDTLLDYDADSNDSIPQCLEVIEVLPCKESEIMAPIEQVSFSTSNKKKPANIKTSLENIMNNVGSQVRKQLSLTSFKKQKTNVQILSSLGTSSSTTHVLSLPKTYANLPKEQGEIKLSSASDEALFSPVMPFEWDPVLNIDNDFENFVEVTKFPTKMKCNEEGLMTSLPDQSVEVTELSFGKQKSKQPLTLAVEQESEITKSKNLKEWDKALLNNDATGLKDFRRIFVYINGKIDVQKHKILCLGFCPVGNILAIGGEHGMLKLFEVANSSNFVRTPNPDVKDVAFEILRIENLEGHQHDVELVTWHSSGERFTTCDSQGVIIGWVNCNDKWVPEMFQNRNMSNVLGISWSPQSSHVCFMYEEINENQELQYGIVMGLLNGSRDWNLDLGWFAPAAITWLEETKFAIIYDNTITIYHSNGQKMQKRCLVYQGASDDSASPKSEKIISFFSKQNSTWTATGSFSLAVVWEVNRMMLFRDINDKCNITVPTNLNATCAAWSPNGLFIAVGGKPFRRTDEISQVNIFSYVGKLLAMINVSEPSLSSISWDSDSFHVAIGANNMLFFGKVRPIYKFASNGSLFAYAFTQDGTNCIAFWNGEKVTIYEVPGTIVDLQSHEERFAILVVSQQGIYSVSVLSKLGVPVDTLCILTMEPFAVRLTDSCLVCLSSNSIIFWKYKTSYAKGLGDQNQEGKSYRQVHVDDHPRMMATVGEGGEDCSKPVNNPAVCMDAKLRYLCIARASGTLQLYHIPQGGIFHMVTVEKFNPHLLMFNPLANRLAFLDMNGCLTFGTLNHTTVEIKRSKATKDVLNIIWAKDMEYHLCVMERTQMYILRNGKVEETFEDISGLQGYLAGFNNLEVTLLRLDDILNNPDQPNPDHVTKVDLQILSKMKFDLINGDRFKLEKLMETAEKRNHPRLWNTLGEGALARGKLSIAETAFVKGKNYSGLMILKQIQEMSNGNLQRAEVSCFLEDYDKAEESYLKANRKDLALKMWKDLGDFTRISLLKYDTFVNTCGIGDGKENHNNYELAALAEKHIQNRDVDAALECYKKLGDYQKILECYMILEDYEGLQGFAETVPKKHSILVPLAVTFGALGMTTDAVKAHLANGDPQTAVVAALENFQWNLALEVSNTHNIPIVAPILLNYTGRLIKVGDIMQAVQLLERCDKTFAAGKLLVMMSLKELREKYQPDLESVKKLFVMAAIMFTTTPKKFFKETKLRETSFKVEDDIDLKFDESIPEDYRPTPEELNWMRNTPWRGAHAVHYLNLVQIQIYRGHFDKATKAANHLRNFFDILGDERVNCMIALASANGGNFYTCSKTFLELEPLDPEYSDIAVNLFRDKKDLLDKKHQSITCKGCKSKLPKYQAVCEHSHCNYSFQVCIITGNILTDEASVWNCSTCGASADARKVKRVKNCPLCHTPKYCNEL